MTNSPLTARKHYRFPRFPHPGLLALVIVIFTTFSTGCLRTPVPLETESAALPRLLETADTLYFCEYQTEHQEQNSDRSPIPTDTIRGHQYFLGIIPFGRITSANNSELIMHYIRREGGMLGMRCIPKSASEERATIVISVDEVSLSGYDYIFFRKPSASIRITAKLFHTIPEESILKRVCVGSSDESEYRQYAFAKELSSVFDKTWSNAMREALSCITGRSSS